MMTLCTRLVWCPDQKTYWRTWLLEGPMSFMDQQSFSVSFFISQLIYIMWKSIDLWSDSDPSLETLTKVEPDRRRSCRRFCPAPTGHSRPVRDRSSPRRAPSSCPFLSTLFCFLCTPLLHSVLVNTFSVPPFIIVTLGPLAFCGDASMVVIPVSYVLTRRRVLLRVRRTVVASSWRVPPPHKKTKVIYKSSVR